MNRTRMWSGLLLGPVATGVVWWSYAQSIAPFLEREREARGAVVSLHERVEGARSAIEEVRTLEIEAQAVRGQIDRLADELPMGPASTWMPELLKQHFTGFGLNASIVRMNTVRDEPDLPGFRRGYWSAGVPIPEATRSATGLLLAVAEFEHQHSFVKVLDFSIRPDPENPQGRIALLNLTALIRK